MKHQRLTNLLAVFLLGAGVWLAVLPLWQQEQTIADGAAVYAELAERLRAESESSTESDAAEPSALPEVTVVPPMVIADVVPIESAESTAQPTESPFFTHADLNTCLSINQDFIGWLFSLDRTDYRTSQNIALYGHHMRRSRSTTMFQPLHEYKGADFFAAHSEIQFDTLYGSRKYTVFAVVNKRESDWDAAVADFGSAEAFQAFLDRAKAWSLYDTGVSVSPNDRILTLITCDRDYDPTDGQLVVMAVLLVTAFIQQENRNVLEVQFMTGDDEFVLAYADCGIYAIAPFFLNKAVDFFFQRDILNETKGMCTFPTVGLVQLRLIGKEFFQ